MVRGINAATYYWDHWNKLIEAAEKEQGGIGAGQGAGGDFIWPLTAHYNYFRVRNENTPNT